MKGIIAFALLLSGAALTANRAACAQEPISIELVLAVDVSGSVNQPDFDLQMKGIATALRSPEVIESIAAHDGVAVSLLQWAAWVNDTPSIPWRLLDSPASILAFAAEVEAAERESLGFLTAIGTAIDRSLKLIATNEYAGRQLTIDVSGDGESNTGLELEPSIALARLGSVTINGLAVITDVDDLDEYFEKYVISGPDAFVIRTSGYENFAEAMRLKLLRELAPRVSRREDPYRSGYAALRGNRTQAPEWRPLTRPRRPR
jgi:hypothetical protein